MTVGLRFNMRVGSAQTSVMCVHKAVVVLLTLTSSGLEPLNPSGLSLNDLEDHQRMTRVDEMGFYPEKILVKSMYYLNGLHPTMPVHLPIWCKDGQVVHASVEERE